MIKVKVFVFSKYATVKGLNVKIMIVEIKFRFALDLFLINVWIIKMDFEGQTAVAIYFVSLVTHLRANYPNEIGRFLGCLD